MPYMDERIARELKRQRMKEQNEEKKKEEERIQEQIDQEAVNRGILAGECQILDRTYAFETYEALGRTVRIHLPSKGIKISDENADLFFAANDSVGISCNIVNTKNVGRIEGMDVYRKKMQTEFPKLKFKWLEEGVKIYGEKKLVYMDYIMITGLMKMHSRMYFYQSDSGIVEMILSYDHDEERYFRSMIQGIHDTLEIK